jgi:thiamine biosynthesis lipoprotein
VKLAALAVWMLVAPSPEIVERRLGLMGTEVSLTVAATSRAAALAGSERAVAALEAAEARLSTWRDDSELARLNQAPPGQLVTLSPELAADLRAAQACWRETRGAFDPSVGALVAAWGLRGPPSLDPHLPSPPLPTHPAAPPGRGGSPVRVPSRDEIRDALARTGLAGLELAGRRAVRRLPVILDEGGFGKGAGLADALAALGQTPGVLSAAVDLGGQVVVFGGARRIAVAHPRQRDRAVVAIEIDRGSVSTSGTSERGSHILDPKTGRPALDFGSLTVWTADPLRADCLSTGLYVLGPEAALAWAAEHPGVEVLVLIPGDGVLTARASPGLAGRLTTVSDNVKLTFGGSQ